MKLRRTVLSTASAALTATLSVTGATGALAAPAAPVPAQGTAAVGYTAGPHLAPAMTKYPWLGAALTGEIPVGDGWVRQQFLYGLAFGNGTEALVVKPNFTAAYNENATVLARPYGDVVSVPGGTLQWFKGGRIYQAYGLNAYAMTGMILTVYSGSGSHYGPLGLPTGVVVPLSSWDRYQQFQGGRIYMSGYGTYPVLNKVDAVYRANKSWLGWPVAKGQSIPGAWTQQFSGGRVYVSPNGRTIAISNARLGGVVPPTGPAAFAMDQVGETYQLYATGPNAWDCSSLVKGSFDYSGAYVGVGTTGIRNTLPVISRSYMKPGDVLWWPGHVAIYLGYQKGTPMVVNAMNTRDGIKAVPLSMIDSYSGYGTALKAPLRAA